MSDPAPFMTVYPSGVGRNDYLLVGLISGKDVQEEEIELRITDTERGQEEILVATRPDEYGYFYITGICTEDIDFKQMGLVVNFVHSGYRNELQRCQFDDGQ